MYVCEDFVECRSFVNIGYITIIPKCVICVQSDLLNSHLLMKSGNMDKLL